MDMQLKAEYFFWSYWLELDYSYNSELNVVFTWSRNIAPPVNAM